MRSADQHGSPENRRIDSKSIDRKTFWIALGTLYAMLVLFSFWRVPIPGVNEPHYLCKAKHFWNPNWCAGDLFLESSNPHLAFYVTFGWLTRFFSLGEVAIIGRFVGLLPVAVGWHLLATQLSRNVWSSLVSAGLFCVVQSAGNWSGEWLLGGIESKVIAYGFLFWAMAQAMQLKLPASAFLAGLAITFHPVVGAWGALVTAIGTTLFLLTAERRDFKTNMPGLTTWGLATLLFVVTAAPGVILAGKAVLEGDADSNRIATYLQVSHRLAHHLDPMQFPKSAYRYFACLILLWSLLASKNPERERSRWWHWLVWSSLALAIVGVLIGWGPRPIKTMGGYEWRIALLKFYPFRLADTLVPVALCIAAANGIIGWFKNRLTHSLLRNIVLISLSFVLTAIGLWIPGSETNPSRMSVEKRNHWIETCQWIGDNSDKNALIFSFDNQWAVKWFAQRPEYVNFKDCPQDAKSIVEWNQRRWAISRWRKQATADRQISPAELQELSQQTGISVVICDRFGSFEAQPDYRNSDFRVYKVRAIEESN